MSQNLMNIKEIPPVLSHGNEKLILVFHPPVFVLNVYSAIHFQMTNHVCLIDFIKRYYFITYKIIPSIKQTYIEMDARSPPLKEV